MKLIACHIENFGKLHDWDYEFQEGCNLIRAENGWGKSTFLAFLRVMLYGFANETKRSDLENERRRFKPWQGGVYGGSLTFEEDGKTYICHRIFGEKEKDDTFELRDGATFLKTADFSSRLGEELFEIDADSFCRSVCVAQLNCDIHFVKATGSINAKLGNLVEDTEDINNFEKVDRKLTDLLNAMSPQRRTGSLYKQKEEMDEWNRQVRQRAGLEDSIGKLRERKAQEIDRKQALAAERDAVGAKQRRLVVLEKRKHYLELRRDCEEKHRAYEAERGWFPGRLPGAQELKGQIELSAAAAQNRAAMEIYRLTDAERQTLEADGGRFSSGVPQREELERVRNLAQLWREDARKLAECRLSPKEREKLAEYRRRFRQKPPTDEDVEEQIRNWELRGRKKEALRAKEASLNLAEAMMRQTLEAEARAKAIRRTRVALFFLAGVLAVTGLFLLFLKNWFGAFNLVFGLASAAAGAFMGRGETGGSRSDPLETERTVFELEEEIKEDALFIEEMEAELEGYLSEYGISWEEQSVLQELQGLKHDACEYRRLSAQEELFCERERESRNEERQREITGFLGRYYVPEAVAGGEYGELLQRLAGEGAEYARIADKQANYVRRDEDYQRQIAQLREYLDALFADTSVHAPGGMGKTAQKGGTAQEAQQMRMRLLEAQERLNLCLERRNAYESARRAKESYEQKEPEAVSYMEDADSVEETADELCERQNWISQQLELIQDHIHTYDLQLNDYEDELDKISEMEAELEEKRRTYEADRKKYRNLSMTQRYLNVAKENLTEKYRKSLTDSFAKYYAMLTGGEALDFRLDANANLTVDEQGLPRKPEFFSTGRRDLLGLCMRMALIDAMYPQKRPFLLLDDPFVNYDDRKREGGMEFLEKVSARYQIIYAACRH